MIMDDEIEDIVGDVNYTDSQKSVTTSNVYSFDFTDSSSDKNNSSSKETYVIEYDDSEDSEKTFHINHSENRHKTSPRMRVKQEKTKKHETDIVDRSVGPSSLHCSIIAHESFTQTSKTILELVQNESKPNPPALENRNSLETQTSFLSITENRTVEYRIRVVGDTPTFPVNNNALVYNSMYSNQVLASTLEDKSSEFHDQSETDVEICQEPQYQDSKTSEGRMLKFVDDESLDSTSDEVNITQYENTSEYENSKYSDMEEDSLIENYRNEDECSQDKSSVNTEIPKSVDNDIEELYSTLSHNVNPICKTQLNNEPVLPHFTSQLNTEPTLPFNFNVGVLTPVTEETNIKVDGITDMSPSMHTLGRSVKDTDSSKNFELKFKEENETQYKEERDFRLPPIRSNYSCPNSPLNFLFTTNAPTKLTKNNTLPLVAEDHREISFNRWEIDTKCLASGESQYINGRNEKQVFRNDSVQLPPIHIEGPYNRSGYKEAKANDDLTCNQNGDTISIQGRIRELKINQRKHRLESRSASPQSTASPNDPKLSDTAERGCDALCSELKKRLQINSWCQALETLEELPKALDKFWSVISETRIADLLRQVTVHVESPRTQVSRAACQSLAEILKNTNYTKKPDFYEAMGVLLVKTGSFCRPLRRAANVALDDIVCNVDTTHAITAICVYGTCHKSALVRSASARLLVVCAALAEGGRQVLRCRPPTAAAARRHVLRALADMLTDKNTDTRKYAERLYAMLRPLPNFEAFYLTDVDVDIASKQIKKYDQLLLPSK